MAAAVASALSAFPAVLRFPAACQKGELMKKAAYAALVSLLMCACRRDQPKLAWEYPAGSSAVSFQICHVAKGQTQETCRPVENPQQQPQGEKVLYTVPLTGSESEAERIGVVACRGACSPATWVRVDVK
jgi:hypothetical protein